MTISVNPAKQTNFSGTFSIQSDGYIQGLFMDDPATRYALAGGVVASGEAAPMFGGIAIGETIPDPANQATELGGIIARATAYTDLTGFTVFNQNGSAIISPPNTVPLADIGMQVNFFRLGSGARIAVACDDTLAQTLAGGSSLINVPVSWDFTNQKLVAFSTTALACKVLNVQRGNSKTVQVNSGVYTWNPSGTTALIEI